MAKDKDGNKIKSDKPAKAKVADGFAKPSEAPVTGEGWNMTEEAEGELLLLTPLREEDVDTADYGIKKVIVANVVVINLKKPEKSEEHTEVFVWGGYLKGSLRGFIGERRVAARLVRGEKKERGNFPWLFEDPSEADYAACTAYLESVDPFKNKS